MAHPILLGVLAGIFVAKLVARRRHRFAGGGFAGGGCGGYGARFDASRGGHGGYGHHPFRGFWGRRAGGFGGTVAARVAPASERLATLAADLELNKRQKEEFDAVIARIREVLGSGFEAWPAGDALALVASGAFDVTRASAPSPILP